MRFVGFMLLAIIGMTTPSSAISAETIDGGVVQVRLPGEDATLLYVETRGGMTVKLQTDNSSIAARKMYLGDGNVAVLLEAHPLKGPVFQGDELDQGYVFQKDATIKVRPGYKKAVDLPVGSLYVILPGVTFEVPKKPAPTIDDLLRK
jgi:hypothetical protein